MPKFTLPAPKKPAKKDANVGMSVAGDYYRRKVMIPVNKEILDALDIDDKVTVTLEGKVCELSSHVSAEHKDRHIEVEVKTVEAYPETKAKAEQAFSNGYKKGERANED